MGCWWTFPKPHKTSWSKTPPTASPTWCRPPGRFLLGNAQLPAPPAQPITLGEPLLYHAQVDSRTVRVALLEVDYGSEPARQRLRVQGGQSLTVRERIAQELLEQLLLPMGLMGLVLSALVYAGVLRGLQPLKRLEAQIERPASAATTQQTRPPIELTSAPQEVYSLASTINRLLEAVARGQQKEKRFLNDAAHQLRTPLAGLIGQTELALHESHEPQVRERLHKSAVGRPAQCPPGSPAAATGTLRKQRAHAAVGPARNWPAKWHNGPPGPGCGH